MPLTISLPVLQQSRNEFIESGFRTGPKQSTLDTFNKLIQLEMWRGHDTRVGLFTFLIPPENYTQTEAARAQVVQTLGGGYADLFGPALVQIRFQGTTGLQTRIVNGFVTDGFERFQALLGTIRGMWRDPVQFQTDDWHFYFWNWTDSQFFEVLPLSNSWTQAVPRQLVFYYDIQMIGLRRFSSSMTNGHFNDQTVAQAASRIPGYAIRDAFTDPSAVLINDVVVGTN
jgi:hypothetical protein